MLCKLKDEPYLMRNENTKQYYGYLIDLLDRISFICNFTYEISIIKKTREDKKNDQNWKKGKLQGRDRIWTCKDVC